MNSDGYGKDIKYLIKKLVKNYYRYFDKNGVLNSDGRRLLYELTRFLVYEHPEFKKFIQRLRKEPTLENILKLAEKVMDLDDVLRDLEESIYGPYTYTLRVKRNYLSSLENSS